RPGGEAQRRRSASRDRQRAERTPDRLCPPDEAQRVDQSPAELPWGAERHALRPRLRHRGRRVAAREAAPAERVITPHLLNCAGSSAGETSSTSTLAFDSCS